MSAVVHVGCVHGRFQLLHNEHLEYITAAKARCGHLIIGITNYDMKFTVVHAADVHRSDRFNNPLSYYERTVMIRRVLDDEGLSQGSFSFSPFPIEHPEDLPNFVGLDVVCFTTVREEWNREKIKRLRSLGYQVDVLLDNEKRISAKNIRNSIAEGRDDWRSFVPPATAAIVDQFHIAGRLRAIAEQARLQD